MSDPITIQYGPWVPDLSNVPVPISSDVMSVPTVDCLNVYYADGCYRGLPGPQNIALSGPLISAFTGTDASGAPFQVGGTSSALFTNQSGSWHSIGGPFSVGARWQFAQYGENIYAVDQSLTAVDFPVVIPLDAGVGYFANTVYFTGSVASGVLTVSALTGISATNGAQLQVGMQIYAPNAAITGVYIASLGSGTGGPGTYNLSASGATIASSAMYANLPPVGNVVATSGQFLIYGNIAQLYQNNAYGETAYTLGTGNGTNHAFSGTIPNTPLRKGTVTVFTTGGSETDNGQGGFTGSFLTSGSVDYVTGTISVVVATAPANAVVVYVAYTQTFQERIWWSAIGLPNFFPVPLTNTALAFQSSFEDLEGDLGPVQAIVGYPLYFLVFQKNGITRAIYQGGNVVFAIATYEWKRGLIAQNAYVQVGANVYFLSDQGFFYTDGANVYPIGTANDNSAGIDKWFWSNVNLNYLSTITAAYDATLRCIVFAICTGTNTEPDTLLIYNLLAQRWTRAHALVSFVWSDSDGERYRVGAVSQSVAGLYYYQQLTGAPLSGGYLESCDLTQANGHTSVVTGVRPNIACTDTPLASVGTRNTLQAAITYAGPTAPDAFGAGIAPFLSEGLYLRIRISSGAASAITGATAIIADGGMV